MPHIGFIGLGNMGGPMAGNLVKAGEHVSGFDVVAASRDASARDGVEIVANAGSCVENADVVITMLPAGVHVRQVFAESVLPNAQSGALLIDCSTIDVDSARAVGAQARAAGFDFADAPVSGGIAAAEAGSLTFMVGCDEALFPRVEQALQPMAKAVIHAGEAGAGQAAKICNNMVLGVSMLGVCEAFALAEKLGLAADKFYDIAAKSSGQCWSITSYCPWPGVGPASPSDRGYEGGFLSALMLKDLKLAQEAAARAGAATPLGAQAEAMYALFDRLGFGGKDFSGVLQLMRGRLDELDETVRGGG
jgi:3-hydroxyisobutyrate dehydrogenase